MITHENDYRIEFVGVVIYLSDKQTRLNILLS